MGCVSRNLYWKRPKMSFWTFLENRSRNCWLMGKKVKPKEREVEFFWTVVPSNKDKMKLLFTSPMNTTMMEMDYILLWTLKSSNSFIVKLSLIILTKCIQYLISLIWKEKWLSTSYALITGPLLPILLSSKSMVEEEIWWKVIVLRVLLRRYFWIVIYRTLLMVVSTIDSNRPKHSLLIYSHL